MSRNPQKPNSIQNVPETQKAPRRPEERKTEDNGSSKPEDMEWTSEQHQTKSTKMTDSDANRTDDPAQNFQKPENRQCAPKDPIETPALVGNAITGRQPTIPARIPHEQPHSEIRKPPAAVSRQSTQPNTLVKRKQGTATEDSQGLLSMVTDGLRSFCYPESNKYNAQYSHEGVENSTRSATSASANHHQTTYQKRSENEEIHRGNGARQETRKPEVKEGLRKLLEAERRKWEQEKIEFKRDWNNMAYNHNIIVQNLRAELQECESQKQKKVEELNNFIYKQQEATLKHMTSARWLPDDESSAKGDLETLKLNMKNWAKGVAARDNSLFQTLGKDDHAALIQEVSSVALLEKGGLPSGLLSTNKCPMLLLKALLAHSIYTGFFRSPFFFFEEGEDETTSETELPDAVQVKARSPKSKRQRILDGIWHEVQRASDEEAHTWRSETLRVLMPPLRNDSSESTRALRRKTENLIANAAKLQTERFLASPARHLGVNLNAEKLGNIFHDAARTAFKLWTRRITIECSTIHNYENLVFDAESNEFDPDALVRHSNDENHFKGDRVTLLAHPLLKVYGTDDAKDYYEGRVWTKGIVWIDSRAYVEQEAAPQHVG